jgi:hypothetical protein
MMLCKDDNTLLQLGGLLELLRREGPKFLPEAVINSVPELFG